MFKDNRGTVESYKCPYFTPREILLSMSHKNVFRGFHQSPYRKYIIIRSGSIKDTYFIGNECHTVILIQGDSLLIPENAAHGYYVIEDCEMVYMLEGEYNPTTDRKIYYRSPDLPVQYSLPSDCIVSDSDLQSNYYKDSYEFLVLGGRGYLGSNFVKHTGFDKCLVVKNRLDDLDGIKEHLIRTNIKYIVCAAGISKPGSTTEWCETHEEETKKVNFTDVVNLINMCNDIGVHLTYFGSCLNSGNTVYSKWRMELEKYITGNVLYLRMVYPCTFDGHERCFATKMKTRTPHNKLISITNVNELFPKLYNIIKSNTCGIYTFTSDTVYHLNDFCINKIKFTEAPNTDEIYKQNVFN